MPRSDYRFIPLRDADPRDLITLMSDPEVLRHMPLAGPAWNDETIQDWIRAKEAAEQAAGYGPRAIYCEGEFLGWGGLQEEEGDADLGLVLKPTAWGHGPTICRQIIDEAFRESSLESLIVLLPPTRTKFRALTRAGFVPDGDLSVAGHRFLRFRIFRDAIVPR